MIDSSQVIFDDLEQIHNVRSVGEGDLSMTTMFICPPHIQYIYIYIPYPAFSLYMMYNHTYIHHISSRHKKESHKTPLHEITNLTGAKAKR